MTDENNGSKKKKTSKSPKAKEQEEFKCPYCKYTATRSCLLARHVNHYHKQQEALLSHDLVKVLEASNSISDMLRKAADFLAKGDIGNEGFPPEIIARLKQEDAKLQIVARILLVAKIQRVLKLEGFLSTLDGQFEKSLESIVWKDLVDKDPFMVERLAKRIEESISGELQLISDLMNADKINITEVIEKLTESLQPSIVANTFQFSNLQVPVSEDPGKRETMRSVIRGLLPGVLDGSSKESNVIVPGREGDDNGDSGKSESDG